jgi:hypothetical protein
MKRDKVVFMALRFVLGLCAALSIYGTSVATAETSYFAGRQVSIVVGYTAGGAIDEYARLLARHLGQHISGNPNVIVQNMPGAASLTAVRALDINLPKDGTSIVAFNPGLLLAAVMSPDKVRVNFTNFAWLGNMAEDVGVCFMSAASGITTWDQMLRKSEVIMGVTGGGGASFAQQKLLKLMFGVRIRQVAGYPGNADKKLAIERGELDGDCSPWSALPSDWITTRKIYPIVRFSRSVPPGMPQGVLWAVDLTNDKDKQELLDLVNASSLLGKPYILSKAVPSERLQTLRRGFSETLMDTDFLADAEKARMNIASIPYAQAEQLIRQINATSPELVSRAREILGE